MVSLLAAIIIALASAMAPGSRIDLVAAARAFGEARSLAAVDAGRLWGVSLDRPLLFVDPESRSIVASRADVAGALRAESGVHVGTLPPGVAIANTALDWSGVRWAMVIWPLPDDSRDRARLLMHESFHTVQDDLGFPAGSPANAHLDRMDGRLFLQLEWRALAAALRAEGAARRDAISDALVFRSRRHDAFPLAAAEERSLELNEGLAEYTGVVLAGMQAEDVARRLDSAPSKTATFTRSFAYETGPAYGLLLDASAGGETGKEDRSWRRNLDAVTDLAFLLGDRLGIEVPSGGELRAEADRRLAARAGADLRSAESVREERRVARQAELRARFVSRSVILVPLTKATRFTFDPGTLEPLDGVGSVYPTLSMTGEWGSLAVTRGGALIDAGWRFARVPASEKHSSTGLQSGDGYTLDLAEGWRLVPGERDGDLELRRD